MNVIKAAAIMPRSLYRLNGSSLTARMAFVAILVTLTVWLSMDLVYQHSMEKQVSEQWQARLASEAIKERARFREAFSSFSDTARYLTNYRPLQQHLRRWNTSRTGGVLPETSLWKPDWLASTRSVDGSLPIEFALVLGTQRDVHAIYTNGKLEFPQELAAPDNTLLSSVMRRYRIHIYDNIAYLVAAWPADGVKGVLLIASRINQAFLTDMLKHSSGHTVTGLLLGSEQQAIAIRSSDTNTADLQLVSNELLLDVDGGAELRHALWVDQGRIDGMSEQLLYSVRQQRTLVALIFAALFSIAIAWISCRIKKIHRTVEHYSQRLGIHLPGVSKGDHIDRLGKRLERLSEEVIAETSALQYQAQHDNLTNLPNRSLLLEHLETDLQSAQEHGEPLALFIMDLDQFKEVNDTLGHHIGDRLLQEVGRRLVSVLRRTDTVARLGGDEFAVLLPGADIDRSKAVCRKILAAMDRPIKIENFCLRAGISIGVALCPEHGQDGSLLLRYADVAMYEAKRKHKGFSFYTADEDDHSISRLGLSGELRDAIEDNQLTLEYQPMVDFKTGRIFCAEALVRWRHPELGLIPPEEFIPAAEQTGVIRPLTLWVIDRALAQTANWKRLGIHLHISVNLSVRSLQDRQLPGQVQKLVDKHKVDPGHVILEITESAIMSDPLSARRVMRRLSNMGFQLSIDDFGTGYSSLAYLKQLPVDEIKIDKSFVTQMDQDENDAVIVRATIDLAHNLGLKVVAEGVESTDVWDLLEMLGCDTAQGYFIRKPLEPRELANWIHSREWKQARWVTPLQTA